ncbi:reverse transcriptase domain-containing protein, partial [Tanacetum coccineum]
MARTTPRKKFLTPDFSGPPFIEMPRTLSHIVTHVSVREISHNRTKCPKILFRFVRFSTSGHRFHGAVSVFKREPIYSRSIDYVSKWVEAKALPTNDARVVVKFLKQLFSRFGTPRAIISDRGTHFCNDQFSKVLQNYGVTHRLSTSYYPQTSGQVEVSNRGLKRILERTVGEHQARWADKLDDALWAFRTAYKTTIGCTPYKLAVVSDSPVYKSCYEGDFSLLDEAIAADQRRLRIFLSQLKTSDVAFHVNKEVADLVWVVEKIKFIKEKVPEEEKAEDSLKRKKCSSGDNLSSVIVPFCNLMGHCYYALIQELHVLVGLNGIGIDSFDVKLPYHILLEGSTQDFTYKGDNTIYMGLGIAIGGDVFLGSTNSDHLMWFNNIPQ